MNILDLIVLLVAALAVAWWLAVRPRRPSDGGRAPAYS